MGFFGKLSGRSAENTLIRTLLRQRLESDPSAAAAGLTPDMVTGLSATQLQRTTEAMICSVVDTLGRYVRAGLTIPAALQRIETHRATLGRGDTPFPLELLGYLRYRVSIEHRGPPLPEGHLENCLEAAASHFGCAHLVAETDPRPHMTSSTPIQGAPAIEAIAQAVPSGTDPGTNRQARQLAFEPAEPADQAILVLRKGGRTYIGSLDSAIPPDWIAQANEATSAEDAGRLVTEMLFTPWVVTQIGRTDDGDDDQSGELPEDEFEPWSEGYLAQRELVKALNELRMPGERDD